MTLFKKSIAYLITAAMLITGIGIMPIPQALAADKSDFVYVDGPYENTGITGYISEYKGSSQNVIIPGYIDGKPVNAIGKEAFRGKNIKSVEFPHNLKVIGEGAFRDNKLKEIYIPDSVTAIEQDAFRKAADPFGGEFTVYGMNGVKELTEGSFAELDKLSLDIPSITDQVDTNVFLPEIDSFFQKSYMLLFTRNGNKYNLNSVEGSYLVDPVSVTKKLADKTNGRVIKEYKATGDYLENYPKYKKIEDFYQKGQDVTLGIADTFVDYVREEKSKEITLNNVDNELTFDFAPFTFEAPLKIDAQETSVTGKAYPHAKIAIQKEEGSGYWSDWVDIKTTEAGDDGQFTFDELDLKDLKFVRFSATVEGEKAGRISEKFAQIGEGSIPAITQIEEFPLMEVVQGDSIRDNLPKKAKAVHSDGSESELEIFWNSSEDWNANKLGTDWRTGEATYEFAGSRNENKYIVVQKILTKKNESIVETNKEQLQNEIKKGNELIGTVKVSDAGDGSEFSKTVWWVTQDVMSALEAELKKAKEINLDNTVDQETVNSAFNSLKNVIDDFNGKKALGTKNEGEDPSNDKATVKLSVNFNEDYIFDDVKNLNIKITDGKNTYTSLEGKKEIYDTDVIFEFNDIPLGDYKIVSPDGYILTTSEKIRAKDNDIKFSVLTKDYPTTKYCYMSKGIKVTFDTGENGTTSDLKEILCILGETLDDTGKVPYVEPKEGWSFEGWAVEGKPISLKTYRIEKPVTVTACYEETTGAINKSTPIGNGWVLGDFTYSKDVYENITVSGFSENGEMKLKTNHDLFIPRYNPVTKEKVTIIDIDAFKGKSINSVNIPEGITSVYPYAFSDNNIKSVTFPKTVELIGVSSFYGNRINEIKFNDGEEGKGVQFIRDFAFSNNNLREVEIPSTVKVINQATFSGNKINKLILHEGLEKIDSKAFEGNLLETVEIPLSLSFVHDEAFYNNKGLLKYNGKVALYTPDKKSNPNNLASGQGHVINPDYDPEETPKVRKALHDTIISVLKVRHDQYVTENSSEVPKKETYISPKLAKRVDEAIYEGYYAYYDVTVPETAAGLTPDNKHAIDGRTVEKAHDELVAVKTLMETQKKNGTGVSEQHERFFMRIGLPGFYDIKNLDGYEFAFISTESKVQKAYREKEVLDDAPNVAGCIYQLPKGKYRFKPQVGYLLTVRLNGVDQKEDDPYVTVPDEIVNGMLFPKGGFGAEEGFVFIYDIGDKGTTEDEKIETVRRQDTPTEAPEVKGKKGYKFVGWSLNGENVVPLKGIKAFSDTVLKAVYEEDSNVGENLNYVNFDKAIVDAKDAKKGILISDDGANIDASKEWVTSNSMNELNNAIAECEAVRLTASTQDELDKAVSKLNRAVNNFKAAKQFGKKAEDDPTPENKIGLKKLYEKAKALKAATLESTDGKDVAKGKYWAKKSDIDDFVRALVEANFQLLDKNATDNAIEEARFFLEASMDEFNTKRFEGLKSESSGGVGSGSGGSGSSGGGSGNNAGNTVNPVKNIDDLKDSTVPLLGNPEQEHASAAYSDIDRKQWYRDAIDFVIKNKYFNGISKNEFAPNINMTRAMFVTVLSRMENIDVSKYQESKFTDVEKGKWYSGAVNWASNNDIVKGIGNNKFNPNGFITRQEMASIMYRYATYKKIATDNVDETNFNKFADKNTVASWAKVEMLWATSKGIINGTNIGIEPGRNATRAQVAQIIKNFSENTTEVKSEKKDTDK